MKDMIMKYYSIILGKEPDISKMNRTISTAKYLLDNNYTNKEIFNIFSKINKEEIKVEDLPEELWNESLLSKCVYYYSGMFHIKSKPPIWNPITFKEECEPFFKEMKMHFSLEDLLEYYYDKCRVPLKIRDEKRDAASFEFLLKKYNNLDIPNIDYIIYMINLYSEDINKDYSTQVFEIEEYRTETLKFFDKISKEADLYKENQIVWRNEIEM